MNNTAAWFEFGDRFTAPADRRGRHAAGRVMQVVRTRETFPGVWAIDALPVEYSDDDDFFRERTYILGDGGEILSGRRGDRRLREAQKKFRERVAKKFSERVSS